MAQHSLCILIAAAALPGAVHPSCASAQGASPSSGSADAAITFTAQRSLKVNTDQKFWAQGGSLELGVNAWHGLGPAASITGGSTSSIGSTGTPLALVTETFGPRFRFHDGRKYSVYGEGLIGEANAFHSVFPSVFGAQADANSLATQVGGGLDLRASRRISIRALQAAWLRTQLPNSTSNIQNNLLLGAGLVFRLSHN